MFIETTIRNNLGEVETALVNLNLVQFVVESDDEASPTRIAFSDGAVRCMDTLQDLQTKIRGTV